MDAAFAAKDKARAAASDNVFTFYFSYYFQNYAAAIDYLTEALRYQYSNLTLIRRAEYLLKVSPPRPNACIHDCDYALSRNPDSAKGLKIRGKAYAYF